jgi:hypothetical protein
MKEFKHGEFLTIIPGAESLNLAKLIFASHSGPNDVIGFSDFINVIATPKKAKYDKIVQVDVQGMKENITMALYRVFDLETNEPYFLRKESDFVLESISN